MTRSSKLVILLSLQLEDERVVGNVTIAMVMSRR
jgi:hypothetical protein